MSIDKFIEFEEKLHDLCKKYGVYFYCEFEAEEDYKNDMTGKAYYHAKGIVTITDNKTQESRDFLSNYSSFGEIEF